MTFFRIAIVLLSLSKLYATHAITYGKEGRFGDSLLCYLHAKWISFEYNIPLYYKPFGYSSLLVLHDKEKLYEKKLFKHFAKAQVDKTAIDLRSDTPTLYVCPYFPEDRWELENVHYYHFEVGWKNPIFRKLALEMIAPNRELSLIHPPQDTVNIAIHVREGGGFDPADTRLGFPLKLPPLSYYCEALAKVMPLLQGKKVHCHLFTDAKDPKSIAEILSNFCPGIQYREKNSHKENVLEDFFSLFLFDILIRPSSNFSLVPALLHDFVIDFAPVDFIIEGDRVTIHKTNMNINKELFRRLLTK